MTASFKGKQAKKKGLDCSKPFFTFKWWVLTVSNRRPTPCKGAALPTELRTHLNFFVSSEHLSMLCPDGILAPWPL